MARVYTVPASNKRNKSETKRVLPHMDQMNPTRRSGKATRPIQVEAPHDYDGIGQALRAIYRDRRITPDPIVDVLRRLDAID